MRKKTTAWRLLTRCAEERRRVISEWRVLIELRRIAQAAGERLPDERNARKLLDELCESGEIDSISGVRGVYSIEVPFASLIPLYEEHAVQEADPWGVFSYLTALIHHDLTNALSSELYITRYEGQSLDRIPLGTATEEWVDINLPTSRYPQSVGEVRVIWTKTKSEWDFGHSITYLQSLPIYITDVERTLIDSIRSPEKCGGIVNVFRAWRLARETLQIDRLLNYTARFHSPLLRQRVGFLLESLRIDHPMLADWKQHVQRGGSMKLLGAHPFSPTHSEAWGLSLNVPPGAMSELLE